MRSSLIFLHSEKTSVKTPRGQTRREQSGAARLFFSSFAGQEERRGGNLRGFVRVRGFERALNCRSLVRARGAAMGNKCGRHAEVRTLSRRNSRQDFSPTVEAQLRKGKKKEKSKKRRIRKKKTKKGSRKGSSGKSGIKNIPDEYTSKFDRLKKKSQKSRQSKNSLGLEKEVANIHNFTRIFVLSFSSPTPPCFRGCSVAHKNVQSVFYPE